MNPTLEMEKAPWNSMPSRLKYVGAETRTDEGSCKSATAIVIHLHYDFPKNADRHGCKRTGTSSF